MDYQRLADLLYPNVTKTTSDYEKMYPERNLPEGAEVCRFAPSPTGRLHMGSLYASFIPEVFARQSKGIFILRIEDTDDKRAIEDGTKLIFDDLKAYDFTIDESPLNGGEYGPYIQTERKDIYAAFAKYLVSIGRAYPCFCSEEDLNEMRERQEHRKERIGYYGPYAKCRNLTYEEVKEHLDNGDKFVIRLKSMGDFNKKIIFKDLVKGTLELPQNDIDQVLVKSDGIPPYAFAHVVDDHLMRVTTITRDDSYISSVPYHMEIWEAFGFKKPKYAHILPLCIKDGNTLRKISKRKDPWAAVSYHHENGIPVEAVKLYFATLLNSNFEGWLMQNPDKSYRDFTFTFNKMTTSGSLFDMEKLTNISKNYLSKLTASEVYDKLDEWTKEFDPEFNKLINKYKEYTISVLNIEREQKKPRKDFAFYSEIKNHIWYMYDELFTDLKFDFTPVNNIEEIKNIINLYIDKYYNYLDTKDEWFNKIRNLAEEVGYASDMKDYKEDPTKYKGSISDISNIIRIMITSKNMTPDLYEIMQILGNDRVLNRLKNVNNL
jgi:glutamyl-tRNA synthetase